MPDFTTHIQLTEKDKRRFASRFTPGEPDECWLWQGYLDRHGYGRFSYRTVPRLAHRISYEIHVGPIPKGMELDHVADAGCRHRHCVNPAHLEPVTHRVNCHRRPAHRRRKQTFTTPGGSDA